MQTIREVSRDYGVSTRTLRYYEAVGLLQSQRVAGYAYRVYEEDALQRLKQILLLRQLRLPLKDIRTLLEQPDPQTSQALLERRLRAVQREGQALGTLARVLQSLLDGVQKGGRLLPRILLEEPVLQAALQALPAPAPTMSKKGDTLTMGEWQSAQRELGKLQDVRILTLPACTVAAFRAMGSQAEWDAHNLLQDYLTAVGLEEHLPGFRMYGFNHSDGPPGAGVEHGYECWATIPEDWDVPEPGKKVFFPGGLYAAHMIPMGAFEEWALLSDWVQQSPDYCERLGDPACMCGLLEEHLNYCNLYALSNEQREKVLQLDLLFPIQPRRP